jgi:hypothetical protein
MHMRWPVITVAVLGLAACGGKPAAPAATPARVDPEAVARTLEPEIAAIHGALPENLQHSIDFAPIIADDDRLVLLAPSGWEAGGLPGTSRPPQAQNLGFMTQLAVGTSCDGACGSPKDWADAAERIDLARFRGSDFTVLKDEPLDGGHGHLLVSKTVDRTHVVLVRWHKDAARYAFCRVTLDQEVAEAAPAFAAACKTMKVLTWQ